MISGESIDQVYTKLIAKKYKNFLRFWPHKLGFQNTARLFELLESSEGLRNITHFSSHRSKHAKVSNRFSHTNKALILKATNFRNENGKINIFFTKENLFRTVRMTFSTIFLR